MNCGCEIDNAIRVVRERLQDQIGKVKLCGAEFGGERTIEIGTLPFVPRTIQGVTESGAHFDAELSRCWGDYPKRFRGVYIVNIKESADD